MQSQYPIAISLILCLFSVHVIIATPGRILDLMDKMVANMQNCKILVLDEVSCGINLGTSRGFVALLTALSLAGRQASVAGLQRNVGQRDCPVTGREADSAVLRNVPPDREAVHGEALEGSL